MTDRELDVLMKRIMIDSIKLDLDVITNDDVTFEPSLQHRRQIELMLKDPLGWSKKRGRSIWKTVAYNVAAVLLIISLGFGILMASSPTARAVFIQWVTEWYETHIAYYYEGGTTSGEIPQYEITELPEGFVESERIEFPELVSITYENEAGDAIYFNYSLIVQGGASGFYIQDSDVFDIEVNHMSGQFFELNDPGSFNTITWIDTNQNIQFDISCVYNYVDILHMATSVSLVKTTK